MNVKYRKRFTDEEKLKLIMECRNSGLSDHQWCIENNIPNSTMYNWIKKLRNNACSEISENPNKYVSCSNEKQDVVCIDVKEQLVQNEIFDNNACEDSENITLQCNGVQIIIPDNFNAKILATVISVLR